MPAPTSEPGPGSTGTTAPTRPGRRRISGFALSWRIAAMLLGIVLVVNGSVRMHDDVWPFGPMSQYAFTPGPDDTVVITRVQAQLVDGTRLELPLTHSVTGIGRAEVEAQIPAIERQPALLSAVADGWIRTHPGGSRPTQLWLVQDHTALNGGKKVGTSVVQLAHWVVPE